MMIVKFSANAYRTWIEGSRHENVKGPHPVGNEDHKTFGWAGGMFRDYSEPELLCFTLCRRDEVDNHLRRETLFSLPAGA